MSFHLPGPAYCIGIFLLLATAVAVCAGEDRSCDAGAGSIERHCTGQGRARIPTPAQSTLRTSAVSIQATVGTGLLHEGLDWEYCGLRPIKFGPAVRPPPLTADGPLSLSADAFDYDQERNLLWLRGDVRGAQNSRFVAADEAVYDHNTSDLKAKGNVFLTGPGVRLIADEAQMNLESDQGSLSGVYYRLMGKINAHGNADQAELINPTLTRYRNIVYSACRPGQRQQAWSLDAAELELDQVKGQSVARQAKLRVRGLPVFYSPHLSFPIDDRRKSGFLVPSFGTSDRNGINATIPYYWNIAPHMDATFSVRHMTKRGPMLGTEFRYLSPHQWMQFSGELLPQDRQRDSQDARWALRIEQEGSFSRRWSTALDYRAVSDSQYFEDFGARLEQTSVRHIERRGDLHYSGDSWYLLTRLQEFQTLDEVPGSTSSPHARLPQMTFGINPRNLVGPGIELGLSGEYNYFHHDTIVHGHRTAFRPFARWPLRKRYGHLIPQLDLHLAGYDLQDQQPDGDPRPFYAIPSFNLDAELVFERTAKWFGQESLQTLEPRVFYLHTPFTDQAEIPVFDTAEQSFSYDSLFRPNRFVGWDRVGDANQVALGLTSRTLAKDSGQELLRASIGQILYARDRDVQLSGPPEKEGSSPIAGLLSARFLRNLTGYASFEYDPNQETNQLRKQSLELHYQTSDNRLLNLAYRFALGTGEEKLYENTDLSFSLPVNRQFQLVGRWHYSLLDSQTVEAFAGLEYGQCCWRVRLLGHHLKNEPGSAGTNSIMLQLELAGLGSIGQRVDRFIERGIYYSIR